MIEILLIFFELIFRPTCVCVCLFSFQINKQMVARSTKKMFCFRLISLRFPVELQCVNCVYMFDFTHCLSLLGEISPAFGGTRKHTALAKYLAIVFQV